MVDDNCDALVALAAAGGLHTYIDKVYSVNKTTEAIQYLLSSHTSGRVVIKMDF